MIERSHESDTSYIPFATELSLQFETELFATGWQPQIDRPLRVEHASLINWSDALEEPPEIHVFPIQLSRVLPKIIGFVFPESPAKASNQPNRARNELERETPSKPSIRIFSTSSGNDNEVEQHPGIESQPGMTQFAQAGLRSPIDGQRRSITRIQPPGDLVKLEDRLYYVLQPPLESLVSSAQLQFPFPPFPYQMEGIAFLFPRSSAILADEMGLGKTMQAITAIRMLLLAEELQSVLLICPKPLVTNWVREFQAWAPELPVAVIEGDQSLRQWIWNNPNLPIKIANYELMMRDRAELENGSLRFDLVVLDEAQRIKNRSSATSQIVRSIQRSRSWALTGTPIENSSDDLVSIFEFLAPGYLRDDMHLKSMGKATRDYILRRTKDLVMKEMPPKLYRDAELELTSDQWASYKSAEEDGVIELSDMGDAVTIQHVFELVLRLKQICNFDPRTGASSKMERLEADLEEIAASGQKAIVFSQWVHAIDEISERIQRFHPLHYHGRIPSNKRDAVIQQFKTDPKHHVILMSYGAGAVGLNLQFCHYVFLFDRWWNPAVEDQAINRAHRLGVTGPVTVTRMMALGTIEERIHGVLEQKRELSKLLFAEAGTPRNLGLNQDEIFGLFKLSKPRIARAA